jgi:alpha-tubulin suppressor-like RCC1 family protein
MIIPHFKPIIFNPSLLANNLLFSWGRGVYGRLGISSSNSEYFADQPIKVDPETKFKEISVSPRAGLAIKQDGTLWSWGYNEDGRLGINGLVSMSSPVQVGSLSNWAKVYCARNLMAITNDNKLYGAGPGSSGSLIVKTIVNTSSPVQVGTSSGWKKVAAYTFNLGIK